MKIIETIDEIRKAVKAARFHEGRNIALVPTMGYLHDGHLSLIDKAKSNGDFLVVSIFVNPSQFGPGEDYDSYPVDLERDIKLCEKAGVDIIFHPGVEEMYHGGNFDLQGGRAVYVNPNESVATRLCGGTRPTHFRGVMTVVAKLFNIVTPDRTYFGQKDAQQLALIKNMVRDLKFDIEVISCPIIREADGIAMSSRNTYLSEDERKEALALSMALKETDRSVTEGEKDCNKLLEVARGIIENSSYIKIDYLKIVDTTTLEDLEIIEDEALMVVAAYVGKTRLIDNWILEGKK